MIKNFLKGMVVGLANIIPGVSGGTMMVVMGIYDKLIHCITHLFSNWKANLKFLLPIFLGAGVALLGLSFVIEPAFEYFPLQTTLLFIGLIMGGVPAIAKKLRNQAGKVEVKPGYIVSFLIFAAVVIVSALLKGEGQDADLTLSLASIIKLVGVGIVASATMVIPGVSGSMMLMLLGYYKPVISTLKELTQALLSFNGSALLHSLGVMLPFAIGIVIGIFAIAKAVEYVFKKFPLHAYWAILGLVLASPIAIVLSSAFGVITVPAVIVSAVTFAVGFAVAYKLGE